MAVFPKLADPRGYTPVNMDFPGDPATVRHWMDLFTHQIDSVLAHALESRAGDASAADDAAAARRQFLDYLHSLPPRLGELGPATLMDIDRARDQVLRQQGFTDSHRVVKQSENDLALPRLPGVLAEIDALEGRDRLLALVRGVFAGNIFDLGVKATIDLHANGEMDFHAARERIAPRPWLVDDFDLLAQRWAGTPHRLAAVLVDNAGADIVLGMIPLIRELARRGTRVVVGANTLPSLNDITHAELAALLGRAAALDRPLGRFLAEGRVTTVATGNAMPLIDLAEVSPPFAAACADADLVILEGMGRAVESNFAAAFTCDALKLAMLKDRWIAGWLGGGLYDVVCRFEPG